MLEGSLFPQQNSLTAAMKLESLQAKEIDLDLTTQLASNRAAMHLVAEGFSEEWQRFIKASIDAALFCHSGHTRIGNPPIHYSHHLLEVMRRVHSISTAEPAIDEKTKAIRLSVAVLHDSMEDIAETFTQITDRKQGADLVEHYIRARLQEVTTPECLDLLCSSIRTLSIENDADFNDSTYVLGILNSQICTPIKWADVDHNMLTLPRVGPASGAISYPAQYGDLMKGSPFYSTFVQQVLVSATHMRQKIKPDDLGANAIGRALQELYRFEGIEGLERLTKFYQAAQAQLRTDSDSEVFKDLGAPKKLLDAVQNMLTALEAAQKVLTEC